MPASGGVGPPHPPRTPKQKKKRKAYIKAKRRAKKAKRAIERQKKAKKEAQKKAKDARAKKKEARKRKRDQNPLTMRTTKYMQNQSMKFARKAHKPAMLELQQEQKKLDSIQERRRADDERFRHWLADQNAQYDEQIRQAHEAEVAASERRQQAIQDYHDAQQSAQIKEANQRGVVNFSNYGGINADTRGSQASEDYQRTADLDANTRLRNRENRTGIGRSALMQLAAISHQRRIQYQADTRDINDRKRVVKAETAAMAEDMYQKLLDRRLKAKEVKINKTVAMRELKLKHKALKLDYFKVQSQIEIAKMNNASRLKIAKLQAKADKYEARLDLLATRIQENTKRNDPNYTGKGGKGGKGDETRARKMKETSNKMNNSLSSARQYIRSNPKLHSLWVRGERQKLANILVNKAGLPAGMVPILYDLLTDGKLSKKGYKRVHALGGKGKLIGGIKPINRGQGNLGGR